MNLIAISKSSLIEKSGYSINGIKIKEKIAVDTSPVNLTEDQLSALNNSDIVIFQSKNAVRHLKTNINLNIKTKFFSVGPYTSEFLKNKFNIQSDYPKDNFSTKGLIDKLKHYQLRGKKISIIKGKDGMDTLKENFDKENDVSILNTYQRKSIKDFLLEEDMSEDDSNVFISLSKTSINSLMPIVRKFSKRYNINVIVPSDRFIDKNFSDVITKYYIWKQVNSINDLSKIVKAIK